MSAVVITVVLNACMKRVYMPTLIWWEGLRTKRREGAAGGGLYFQYFSNTYSSLNNTALDIQSKVSCSSQYTVGYVYCTKLLND